MNKIEDWRRHNHNGGKSRPKRPREGALYVQLLPAKRLQLQALATRTGMNITMIVESSLDALERQLDLNARNGSK